MVSLARRYPALAQRFWARARDPARSRALSGQANADRRGQRPRLALLAGLLSALLAGPGTITAQELGPEYVVEAGDSLYTIAARFGTTVEALQSANGLTDPALIVPGQVLRLPGFEGASGRLTTHPVEFGETLASLSLRLGTPPETFVRLNRIVNPAAKYVGEPLVYPVGSPATPGLASATTHIIAPNETLVGLAAQHGVSPYAVVAVNERGVTSALIPGQSLVIPGSGGPPTGLPAPLLSLDVSPLPAEQGRTLRLAARLATGEPEGWAGAGEARLTAALDDRPLRFTPEGETWYALQGIAAEAEPGMHTLVVTVTLAPGRAYAFEQPLPVRRVDYGSQILPPVDPVTLDTPVTEAEWAYLKSLTTRFSPTRYWQGAFALPFGGPMTSPFGVVRTYNGGQLVSSDTGTDFAGPPGSPIYAAVPGVVVMAEPLVVRGNATLIEHGWGVYTGYWHQSQLDVKVSDVVQAGQAIGKLGSTGRVTSPNLHWELWVGGVPVDPMEWTQTAYP